MINNTMSDINEGPNEANQSTLTNDKYTTELRPYDVLLGRGLRVRTYSGNIYFRELILERKERYVSARKLQMKEDLAKEILSLVTGRGGRFVREVRTSSEATKLGVPTGVQAWVFADKTTVMRKIRQALRDSFSAFHDSETDNDEEQDDSRGQDAAILDLYGGRLQPTAAVSEGLSRIPSSLQIPSIGFAAMRGISPPQSSFSPPRSADPATMLLQSPSFRNLQQQPNQSRIHLPRSSSTQRQRSDDLRQNEIFPVSQTSSNVVMLPTLSERLAAAESNLPRLENLVRGASQNDSVPLPAAVLPPSVNIASLASRLTGIPPSLNQPTANEDQSLLEQIQAQRVIINTLRELENSRRNLQLNSSPFGLPYPQQFPFQNTQRLDSRQYSDQLQHSNPIEYANREDASSILAQSLQRREMMISNALNMERLQQAQASLYARTRAIEEKQQHDRMFFTSPSSSRYAIPSVQQPNESPSSSDSGNVKPKAKR